MASRPAKRQRRSTTVVSDDSASETDAVPLTLRSVAKSGASAQTKSQSGSAPTTPRKRSTRNTSKDASPRHSPGKARKLVKTKQEVPNRSLHNFFGKATEEQRWRKRSHTPEVNTGSGIEDDIIDDDVPDEFLTDVASQGESDRTADRASSRSFTAPRQAAPTASQKFAKPALPSSRLSEVTSREVEHELSEKRPWADRYGPNNLGELAVHKKKVSDVQKWLEDVLSGRDQRRLLVLKGPAGSGKTSTVSLIANASGINVVPWYNSTTSEAGTSSNVQQFNDFLNRGGQFESLDLHAGGSIRSMRDKIGRRLILVEEFPTISNSTSNALDAFRAAVSQYLAASSQISRFGKPSVDAHPPIVMIISETLISSSTALSDSFTAHRLLGPEVLNHPLASVIDFNSVAPTFVQKALETVVKKEARDSSRKRIPGRAIFQKLADIGDLRSAINSLEFFCARGDDATNWSGTVATLAKKKDGALLTEVEKNTLELVSARESTLDMFHATGKIVYNKREDPRISGSRAEPPPKPPDHLLYLHKPKVSQVDVEALLSETGTDIQTFISTLHENYILSCNGEDFVDDFDGCAGVLSDSDILNPESRNLIRAKGSSRGGAGQAQAGNFEMLRQDEISFQTATRGLLFSLPFPVNRASLPGARKQDAFKMFYPTSLRLWKPAEEVNDLVSLYGRSGIGVLDQAHETRVDAGVASWRSKGFSSYNGSANEEDYEKEITYPPLVTTSRDAQVLDLLPFMATILAHQKKDVKVLERIAKMRGARLTDDEENGDDGELADVSPTDDNARVRLGQKIQAAHDSLRLRQSIKTGNRSSPTLSVSNSSQTLAERGEGQVAALQKLYISDDDIQDD